MENKSDNLTYCSSLQPTVVYNFSKIESTFPVPLWGYVSNFWWLRGMVSICLIRKGKYNWLLAEGLLLDWLIFLLYLLQSVCCSKYSAKTTNFKSIYSFPTFLKHFRVFVSVTRSKFHCLFRKGNLVGSFINFVMWSFACMV